VAPASNPSYSRSRDQEDCVFQASLDKQFKKPYLKKKPFTKKRAEVAKGVGPEFKPQF
jgi:hypothetical protein